MRKKHCIVDLVYECHILMNNARITCKNLVTDFLFQNKVNVNNPTSHEPGIQPYKIEANTGVENKLLPLFSSF